MLDIEWELEPTATAKRTLNRFLAKVIHHLDPDGRGRVQVRVMQTSDGWTRVAIRSANPPIDADVTARDPLVALRRAFRGVGARLTSPDLIRSA